MNDIEIYFQSSQYTVGTRTEPLRPGNHVETGAGKLIILIT